MTPHEQLEEISRGTIDLVSRDELFKKLDQSIQTKKPLRIKLGVDPTSADIHLGHTVQLQKLRQFQNLGHTAVLIIGDYTALVGDPSGTLKTRPQLSLEDVQKNAKTYFEQVQQILDMKRLEVRYNGEWFSKMPFVDVVKLTSKMTVARMLEREDFSKRYKEGSPICIHEFIYPLMQGYDSLMVRADVEIGGTDQIFNLLVGRNLQKEEGLAPQVVLTMPLLEGTDGVRKMSKTYGNYIGVTDPAEQIFGKIMSISDDLMWKYYALLSSCSEQKIKDKKKETESGILNPKDLKVELALELVTRFHSKDLATQALEEFKRIFSEKKNPTNLEEMSMDVEGGSIGIVDLLTQSKSVSSHAEAKRLIQQGGVSIDGSKITDIKEQIKKGRAVILKVGKRFFKKIYLK